MVNLSKAKQVLVNNTFFEKRADGKWYSAQDVMWESAFLGYCSRANSVVIVDEQEKEEKKVVKSDESVEVKPKKHATRINLLQEDEEIDKLQAKTEEK